MRESIPLDEVRRQTPMLDHRVSRSILWTLLVGGALAGSGCEEPQPAPPKEKAAEATEASGSAHASKAATAHPSKAEAGVAKIAAQAAAKVPYPATCDDAGREALQEEMMAVCAVEDRILTVDAPLAPWPSTPSVERHTGTWLDVTVAGISVNGHDPIPMAQLPEALARSQEMVKEIAFAQSLPEPGWGIVIAQDVPRSEVAAVFAVLVDAELTQGYLLLATEDIGELPEPRDPAVMESWRPRIRGTGIRERGSIMGTDIRVRSMFCLGYIAAFSAVATVSADQRCEALASGISLGWMECGCPESDEVLTLTHAYFLGGEPPTRLSVGVSLTLDPEAASRPGATWGTVVAGLDVSALDALWVGPT